MFKKWLYLVEMGDAVTDSLDDINLQRKSPSTATSGWKYQFSFAGNSYEVEFDLESIDIEGQTVVRNGITITLLGPGGTTLPTGLGNPTPIYNALIKAVRKMLQVAKPEGLHFSGAVGNQDIVYQSFYKKYLQKMFTRVTFGDYIRNDILQHWQQTNDPKWRIVTRTMKELADNDYVNQHKQAKNAQRREAMSLIGKIALYYYYDEPVYLKSILPPDGYVGIRLDGTQQNFKKYALKSFDHHDFTIFQSRIEELQKYLQSIGIQNANIQLWQDENY